MTTKPKSMKPKSLGIKLPDFQKKCTYLSFTVVAITGVWWSLLHDFLMSPSFTLTHNLLIIHGVFAAVSLVVLGGLIPQHIRLGWQTKRNITSGLTVAIVALIIALTGLGLYYLGEDFRDPVKWVHFYVGLAAILALPIHIYFGIRSRNKAKS